MVEGWQEGTIREAAVVDGGARHLGEPRWGSGWVRRGAGSGGVG